ncbi:MAG: hydrogenase iron-sulfur subunit [Oscillospiraceae bacterium]|nr:hydrogenase iron-sulfur subunit [Oscillospiraceae bacterium]
MNVLIVGQNKLGKQACEYFAGRGWMPVLLADISQLRALHGQAGGFVAKTKSGEIKAEAVVLTEQPSAPPPEIAGLSTRSLYENDKAAVTTKTDRLEPVVFLLDYVCESPLAATIRALGDAAQLAKAKRRVYYLARFVRTAGQGIETLYRDARIAGVTFLKYETLEITADQDTEVFSVKASDGVEELALKTRTVYADGGREVGERFSLAASKLNLTSGENGYLTEDKYYLSPVRTSRRGVYHIPRDLAAERLVEGLGYIHASALSSLWDLPTQGAAVIDGEKCVLCYSCYRACTHAALRPDTAARRMQSLSEACAGCGSCASICPGNAITLEKDESIPTIGDKSEKSLVICCENSAAAGAQRALSMLGKDAAQIETRTVPCGGRVSFERLAEEVGRYRNVMVAVCVDDACRHFNGNKRACAQSTRLSEMLGAAGLAPDRICFTQVSHAMPGVFRDALREMIKGGSS